MAPREGEVTPWAVPPVTETFVPSFEAVKGRAEALYVCAHPLVTTNRIRINKEVTALCKRYLEFLEKMVNEFCADNQPASPE